MAQQTPDVRVRLSAEGMDDVVRAFQKVSAAAKKSGKDSSGGIKILNDALGELQGLLPAIGIGAAVAGLTTMVKGALDTADAIGKLSQKTGISTETLSALNIAATLADSNFEALGKGLIKFNKTMGELDQGSATAGAAVRRLFGSAQALNGLNTEARLEKVTTAIGQLGAGSTKTKAAIDFFGKSGAELIPLLDDLANGGFDEARKKAEQFGLAIDNNTAKAAQRANDDLKLLHLQLQGVATQIASGLAPGAANGLEVLGESLASGGESGFKTLGKTAGTVINTIIYAFTSAGKEIGLIAFTVSEVFGGAFDIIKNKAVDTWTSIKGIGTAAAQTLRGDFAGAATTVRTTTAALDASGKRSETQAKERLDRIRSAWKSFNEEDAAIRKKLFEDAPEGKTRPRGGTDEGGVQDDAALKARIAATKADLDNRAALNKAANDLLEQQNKESYDRGLESIGAYFAERLRLLNKSSDEEIATLKAKRNLIAAAPVNNEAERIQQQSELAGVDTQIKLVKAKRAQGIDALTFEEQQAIDALTAHRIAVEDQVLSAQGRTYEAAIAAINQQAVELAKQHLPPALIAQLTQIQTAAANLKEVQRQGNLALGSLDLFKQQLDTKVNAGQLFPFEAVQRYDAAVQAALPKLREFAQQQIAAAQALGPEAQQEAQAFANRIEALGVATNESAKRMADFKASLESSLTSSLANFFSSGIDQAQGFGDAVRLMALSVVDSLRQIAAQMLANILIQKALSALGGFFGFSGGGLVPSSGGSISGGTSGITYAASGGLVSGPGSSTSDSIPARLSAGEFVVRAAAVQRPGVLPLLSSINHGMGRLSTRGAGVPRFADGGLVHGGGAAASGTDRVEIHVHAEEGVAVARIKRVMASDDGQRIQLQTLQKHPKRASAAIGRS